MLWPTLLIRANGAPSKARLRQKYYVRQRRSGKLAAEGKSAAGLVDPHTVRQIRKALGARSLVMVGLMGCGKSAIGRRLAMRLALPFVDADEEIESAAGQSIAEIFAEFGEAFFREGERKVIQRLLGSGPQVLATGGGAFMDDETRANIRNNGISIWLKADLDVLMQRVARRDHRPLLKNGDPQEVMKRLMDERYPTYAEADITTESADVPHDAVVKQIVNRLKTKLR